MTTVTATTSIGTLLGLAFAGIPGALAGAVVGSCAGLLARRWVAPAQPATPTLDERDVLCLRKLETARLRLIRDDSSGEWLDVVSCSLCDPATDIRCGRPCIAELNEGLPAAPVR